MCRGQRIVRIYTDESGGSDKPFFVCGAVRIDHAHAVRVLKRMKKAVRVTGELHAMSLTTSDLLKLLDILSEIDIMATAVHCGPEQQVGRWAMRAMKEHELWQELLIEASIPLLTNTVSQIIADRPKYKASMQSKMADSIKTELNRGKAGSSISVAFRNSHEEAGIQIADTISHCVYRSLMPQNDAQVIDDALRKMAGMERLAIYPIQLRYARPRYLTISEETSIPAFP